MRGVVVEEEKTGWGLKNPGKWAEPSTGRLARGCCMVDMSTNFRIRYKQEESSFTA